MILATIAAVVHGAYSTPLTRIVTTSTAATDTIEKKTPKIVLNMIDADTY